MWLNAKCEGAFPGRHVFGKDVLDKYAEAYAGEQRKALALIQRVSGGRVNFLSDVWQNIAKQHILGCQLSLFGDVMTYALRPTGSEHHALVIAKQLEEILVELLDGGWNVGAIVTDNAGQCGRARRILALQWPGISFMRCFAHDINNLVKAVLKRVFRDVSEQAAAAVRFLNASSEKWRVRADRAMIARYGKSPAPALFSLCLTRWNSMQKCFASLLRVKSALEDFSFAYRNDTEFPDKLRVLGKQQFWRDLQDAEKVVRPLCIASFRLQRDENTLADVVKSFGDIFKGFAASDYSDKLVECVEERWASCEQPLFILGYFLHPVFVEEARRTPSTRLTREHDVCESALYYHRRYIDEDVTGLRGEMSAWIIGQYGNTTPADFSGSIMQYWTYQQRNNPCDKLPVLALTILSIAVNTATCERLFSELGLIHSPRRNQTRVEKTLKQQIVRQHVRSKNREKNTKGVATVKDKATAPLDPTELPTTSSPERCDSVGDHADTQCIAPSLFENVTPGRNLANEAVEVDETAEMQSSNLYTTPRHRTPSSADRTRRGSSVRQSGRARRSEDARQRGSHASSHASRLLYCGAGNLPVLQSPHEIASSPTPSVTRDLHDTFALAGDSDGANDNSGEDGGDIDGDEGCIAAWENAIPDSPVANDAQAPPDSLSTADLGTFEDIIPLPDRTELPTENVPNYPQERTLRGIRARKVKLQILFPIVTEVERVQL